MVCGVEPSLAGSVRTLNSVAMGDIKADLILRGCSLVSVYTGEVIRDTEIAISKGRIAYVGPDSSHARGPGTKVTDLKGRYVCPGFADPHTHIDQFVMPSEFAKQALLHGVTSLFSDPIDIVSVAGYRGFAEFLRQGEGLPVRIFQTVPGGLPVDAKYSHARTLSLAQERSAVSHPSVVGLGEVFSWTKVTLRDPRTIKSISAMLQRDCAINGHTAGASGAKLNAYAASGILSCHEPINFGQVIERLRLGMWIMVREGSIRRDLATILPEVMSSKTYTGRLMFCSDGLDPLDIAKIGHIDHCVREAVRLGMRPADAISMASKNCFDYYNMGRDLGGIAPGKLADILVLDDLESFKPRRVYVGGRLVVDGGRLAVPVRKKPVPAWAKKTVKLREFAGRDFEVRTKRQQAQANTISMQTEIITGLGSAELRVKDGNVLASRDLDVWKVAAFERSQRTGRSCVGFLENFGADIGAFASTWSFHENDMIVIGSAESEMAAAANHLVRRQGGTVVVRQGRVASFLPLQFAGIVSTDPFEEVAANFAAINASLADAGCKFAKPHLIPLFLPFLALPSVRILAGGVVDVKRRELVRPVR